MCCRCSFCVYLQAQKAQNSETRFKIYKSIFKASQKGNFNKYSCTNQVVRWWSHFLLHLSATHCHQQMNDIASCTKVLYLYVRQYQMPIGAPNAKGTLCNKHCENGKHIMYKTTHCQKKYLLNVQVPAAGKTTNHCRLIFLFEISRRCISNCPRNFEAVFA